MNMTLTEYYENCSPNYKKIIDSLRDLDYMISSQDLSTLTGIHFKSIGRYLKVLIDDKIIEKSIYSPENDTRRYSLFYLKGNSKIDGIEHVNLDDIEVNVNTNANVNNNKKEVKKTNIKSSNISANVDIISLKDEILDEIKKTLSNNAVIQKSKSEIIKIINKLPIREVDKKKLGLDGMTSNEVRSHIIDLLDNMTLFKL